MVTVTKARGIQNNRIALGLRPSAFCERVNLDSRGARARLGRNPDSQFVNENAFTERFMTSAVQDIVFELAGEDIKTLYREYQIKGGRGVGNLRIDLLAVTHTGKVVGFELKTRGRPARKSIHAAFEGVGQSLLYHALLSREFQRDVPVFLVSDVQTPALFDIWEMYGLPGGLIEVNHAGCTVYCSAASAKAFS